jgi:hypothetical protein
MEYGISPIHKHVYNYFIRILISFDELCYMKDCIIKKVIFIYVGILCNEL